jgi:uncharacterized protein (DUF427 family)
MTDLGEGHGGHGRKFSALLATDPRDVGCERTRELMDAYVEAELDGRNAERLYPGLAVHQRLCPACRTDHDGLLAVWRFIPIQRRSERTEEMGLAWQQGPLAAGAIGTFLTAEPMPGRLLYAEPLRRRMRVMLDGETVAQSDDVVLLHEPARYPVAYFPRADIKDELLKPVDHVTEHPELGQTTWYSLQHGERPAQRAAWEHTALPAFADVLVGRVAFAWHAMDAFYEEDERIVGHAADPYHRIDIRQSTRHLVVRSGGTLVADTHRPLVLYESGFAPRWYVPGADVVDGILTPVERQTFCPYKGICSYYDIGEITRPAWSYEEPYREVDRIQGFISFEADKLEITLDGARQELPPGQQVVPHGPDRALTVDEAIARTTT